MSAFNESLTARAERAESSLKAAGEAFELESEKVEKAVVEIKRMDCDCSGEGVGSLGGCFRCRALNELSTFGWDFALPSPTKASPPEPVVPVYGTISNAKFTDAKPDGGAR